MPGYFHSRCDGLSQLFFDGSKRSRSCRVHFSGRVTYSLDAFLDRLYKIFNLFLSLGQVALCSLVLERQHSLRSFQKLLAVVFEGACGEFDKLGTECYFRFCELFALLFQGSFSLGVARSISN